MPPSTLLNYLTNSVCIAICSCIITILYTIYKLTRQQLASVANEDAEKQLTPVCSESLPLLVGNHVCTRLVFYVHD